MEFAAPISIVVLTMMLAFVLSKVWKHGSRTTQSSRLQCTGSVDSDEGACFRSGQVQDNQGTYQLLETGMCINEQVQTCAICAVYFVG